MDEQGIPQWDEIYPSKSVLKNDLARRQLHVVETKGRLAALIVVNEEQSPEYAAISWRHAGRALVVHRLTVHPACQRRGLATLLMDFAEMVAAAENCDCIRLDAFTINPAAVALYENRGYHRAGIVHFRKGDFFCYEKQVTRTISPVNQ